MHHAACLQSSVMEPCSVISPVSKPVHGPELWKGTMAQRCWRSQECVLWLLPPINALLEDEVAAICLSTKYSQAAYSCAEIKVLFSSDKCHKGRWLPMRRWGVIHSSRSPSPQTFNFTLEMFPSVPIKSDRWLLRNSSTALSPWEMKDMTCNEMLMTTYNWVLPLPF